MAAKYQHDDIAKIAYRSWLDRGQPDGSPEIDWYYALSVVTNPDEVRPVPFGRFASGETEEVASGETEDLSAPSSDTSGQSLDSRATDADQGLRYGGMQDEGMRNDTDIENNEVTRRSEQFGVEQKAGSPSRSRKRAAANDKDKRR